MGGKLTDMQQRKEHARAARWLLASRLNGVVSTHSLEYTGYPFGSVIPYVLSNDGLPLMLLSHLSQHTKNAEADARCGLTVFETGTGDIQQLERLSAIGDIERLNAPGDSERYFRYFPQSRMYYGELGFRFYRFVPRRFHWNGGFATARWFGSDRVILANPFDAEQENGIVEHMNDEHAPTLLQYVSSTGICVEPDATLVMVGIDAEGIDIRQEDRLYRVPLRRTITSSFDARAVLLDMARSTLG